MLEPADILLAGLQVSYDGRLVLDVDRLHVVGGEALAVLGSNGSGKSTMLRALVGTVRSSATELRCGETDISRWSPHARVRRMGIGYLDQSKGLVREFTVRENFMLAVRKDSAAGTREATAAFSSLVHELEPSCTGLEERWNHLADRSGVLAGDLSGGEQRILAMLMMLVRHPRIVLMDEPLAGVAPAVRELFVAIWRELSRRGATVVVVEQNVAEVVQIMPRAVVLRSGRVQYDGETAALRDPRRVLELL